MTTDHARELKAVANTKRKQGKFTEAGERYTRVAYEYLGESELFPPSTWGSSGLLYMAVASVCYGLADDEYRCINRCQQGILVAEDMLDHAPSVEPSNRFHRANRGTWYEYIGDFVLIGHAVTDERLDVRRSNAASTDELYDRAKEVYSDAGDPGLMAIEDVNNLSLTFFTFVARGADFDLSEFEAMREYETEATLSEWVDYKRKNLPGMIADLIASGEWQNMWDD